MAHPHQDTLKNPVRRYTILQLLQLAQDIPRPFDLSKFTYDAARAGVVPPLGDCAMSLPRTSSNRPRGQSTETGSTNDDLQVFPGNTVHLPHPDRQPHVPPGEGKTQKDEGFARFLIKHASPTHNRVTAGGRIVPMEKRESPPKFNLPQPGYVESSAIEPVKQGIGAHMKCSGPVRGASGAMERSRTASASTTMNSPHEQIFNNCLTSPLLVNPDSFRVATDSSQEPIPQSGLLQSAPTNEPYQQQGEYLQHGPTDFTKHTASAIYAPCMQYTPATWSYLPLASFHPAGSSTTAEFAYEAHPLASCQQHIYQAQALYERLDQQLKQIDRHRATTQHNPALAQQRMEIVQQRDNARTLVKNFEKSFAMEQVLVNLHGGTNFSPQINVQALAYVPSSYVPDQAGIASPSLTHKASPSHTSADKTSSAAKRKPIPIVPPPDNTLVPAQGSEKFRSAPAPVSSKKSELRPEIQHDEALRQEERAAVSDTVGQNLKRPQQAGLILTLQKGHDTTYEYREPVTLSPSELKGERIDEQEEDTKKKKTVSDWMDVQPAPAPVEMEELYDIELDAMRLPKGTITHIKTSESQWVEIVGVDLKCPPKTRMTDFDSKYWRRKPTFTQGMLDRLKQVARIKDVENLDEELLLGRRRASDRSSKENMPGASTMLEDKFARYFHNDHSYSQSRILRALSEQQQNAEVKCSGTGLVNGHGFSTTVSQDLSSSISTSLAENFSVDPMSNKGFSSVLVQPVNATVEITASYDGAGESSRRPRDARSMLASAGRVRSPRVVQRSTPTGHAWYGPYSREVSAVAQSESH